MEGFKLLDLSYLEQVCSGNKAMVTKMIDLFVQQTPLQMEQLRKLSAAGDWHEFFNVAHKMKSSLSMMGVKSLESTMVNLEDYSKNRIKLDVIPGLITHVIDTCGHILVEIENNYQAISK